MSDLISTQESVTKIVDTAIRKILSGEQKLTKEYEQSVIEAVNVILDTARRERVKADAQPEIVMCKGCQNYDMDRNGVNGFCYHLGVPMDAYEWCSRAERRTDD